MIEFFKLLMDKEIFTKRVPVWHTLILASVLYAGWKLSVVDEGVRSANGQLIDHGRHLDRIDDALYYEFNVDTTPDRTQVYPTPRNRADLFSSTNNINLVKTP